MRKRKIWYRKYLFKNHFKSYKDWDKFNPPSDHKHEIRYKSDTLICRNAECPREQMPISEHEAYYYFAKKLFWKKFELKIYSILMFRTVNNLQGNCYVCPFCGGGDMEELKQDVIMNNPRTICYRKKYRR